MRKVELRMNETAKYEIIKKLVESNGNKRRAAIKLACTSRTINRMIAKYREHGKMAFVHGNRNRSPFITFAEKTREDVIRLYDEKYYDMNFVHFSEKLLEIEKISVSPRTIINWFSKVDRLSIRARKKTRSRMKTKIEQKLLGSKSVDERIKMEDKIELIEKSAAHPHRPRCAYEGEMIQMDASQYQWFGSEITHLHVAIDDATGTLVGAFLDTQETLKGYYGVLNQILTNHGIPAMFYTDRRTVFEYKKKKESSKLEDTFTQFSYACHQLGIEIKTTSIPQAKGKVEKLNDTLQMRLAPEMRLAGVSSIEEANEFLKSYISVFNAQFARPSKNIKSVYEKQPTRDEIDVFLSRVDSRVIDSAHAVKYLNRYYSTITRLGQTIFFPKGTKGVVIESFRGNLLFQVNDTVFALEAIPNFEEYSRNFDTQPEPQVKKTRNIPSGRHPWRVGQYEAYYANQKHHPDNKGGANV